MLLFLCGISWWVFILIFHLYLSEYLVHIFVFVWFGKQLHEGIYFELYMNIKLYDSMAWLCNFQAVTNPLQALFNTVVYRRWSGGGQHICSPCLPCGDSSSLSEYTPIYTLNEVEPVQNEHTPLLQSQDSELHNSRMSINGTLTDS